MNENMFAWEMPVGAADGTLTADVSAVFEAPVPWVARCIKASASNDSSATIAVSGGATVDATAIGDSDDPTEISMSDTQVAADTAVVFALDFDGDGGTAGQDVSVTMFGYWGEGA